LGGILLYCVSAWRDCVHCAGGFSWHAEIVAVSVTSPKRNELTVANLLANSHLVDSVCMRVGKHIREQKSIERMVGHQIACVDPGSRDATEGLRRKVAPRGINRVVEPDSTYNGVLDEIVDVVDELMR
jgi:hypothetical protein